MGLLSSWVKRERLSRGWTQQELSERSGVSQATVYLIESGKRDDSGIASITLARLQRALGTAEEMGQAQQDEVNTARLAAQVKGDRSRGIPLINKVPAGEPSEFTDLDYPAGVADDYIDRGDVNDDLAFAFHVFGESMEPDYRIGDVAIVGGSLSPRSGDDCYIRFTQDAGRHAGECTLKRVTFTDGQVVLTPLNPMHRPEVVPREWIEQCYPIIEARRKMLRR